LENHGKLSPNESLNYFKENYYAKKTNRLVETNTKGPRVHSSGCQKPMDQMISVPTTEASDSNAGDIKWNGGKVS
jgi:hypothetical protein